MIKTIEDHNEAHDFYRWYCTKLEYGGPKHYSIEKRKQLFNKLKEFEFKFEKTNND